MITYVYPQKFLSRMSATRKPVDTRLTRETRPLEDKLVMMMTSLPVKCSFCIYSVQDVVLKQLNCREIVIN